MFYNYEKKYRNSCYRNSRYDTFCGLFYLMYIFVIKKNKKNL